MDTMQTLQIDRRLSGRILVRRRPASPHPQIDLSNPVEVARWCRELSTTWLELFNAVERVGTDVAAVRDAVRIR
jgi:Protein of unknown function (DUF3606)